MNVVLAVTGASGSIYAREFIEKAVDLEGLDLYIIFTQTAKEVFVNEIGQEYEQFIERVNENGSLFIIDNNDFNFKFASGSNNLDCMVILPCSMGSLARIAQGLSFDLIGRIADVQLKERRKLVVCPRETPLSLIHLKNMTTLTQSGAVVAPASPSFYSGATTLNQVVENFVERIMDISGIKKISSKYMW